MGEGGAALSAEMVVDGLLPDPPRLRPDGGAVAFGVVPVGQRGEHPVGAVWVAPGDGSSPARRLTAGTAMDRGPRWSPDGGHLYFLSDRGTRGVAQLHRLPVAGGEAEALTDWAAGIADAVPLPGGRTVAVLAADPEGPEGERRARERDDAEVDGERRPVRRLRLLDVETRGLRSVAGLGDRHVAEVAPSPSGDRLAVLTWPTPELGSSLRGAELHVVAADGTCARFVCALPTGGEGVAWDRGGGRLYYLARRLPDWRGGKAVFAVDLPGGPPRPLAADLPACPLELASGPGHDPLVLVAEGLDSWLGRLDPATGALARLLDLPGAARGLSADRDGGTVALVRSTADAPEDVWAGPPAGPLRRLSDLRPELRGVAWGRQERVGWAAPDGLVVEGLLALPPGVGERDGPFPLVVLVHGGPYERFADELQLRPQPSARWLAAAGYAVLLPNPRGGLGRGHAFADRVAGAVGEADWGDIAAGVDRLVARGVADPDRLAVGGWSQGGFMAAWAVGQTGRFKAAVVGAGVSDWGMLVAETDLPHFEAMLAGGAGWEGPGPHRHDALSPISYVSRVATPVLILHGGADERVPPSQARYLARGLREFGVPCELVVYPREPHRIGERAHQLDMLRRTRAWLERWLGPGVPTGRAGSACSGGRG